MLLVKAFANYRPASQKGSIAEGSIRTQSRTRSVATPSAARGAGWARALVLICAADDSACACACLQILLGRCMRARSASVCVALLLYRVDAEKSGGDLYEKTLAHVRRGADDTDGPRGVSGLCLHEKAAPLSHQSHRKDTAERAST